MNSCDHPGRPRLKSCCLILRLTLDFGLARGTSPQALRRKTPYRLMARLNVVPFPPPALPKPLEQGLRNAGLFFLLHAHNCNFRESFFESRGLQFGRHLSHDVLGDYSTAALMAVHTHVERDVEEHALHVVAVILGEFDPAV